MRISDWSSDVCSSDLRGWSAWWTPFSRRVRDDGAQRPEDIRRRGRTADPDGAGGYAGGHGLCACRVGVQSGPWRSEEHTSELQSLMRISDAVLCLQKKPINTNNLHKL